MNPYLISILKNALQELENHNYIEAEKLTSLILKSENKNIYVLQLMGIIKGSVGEHAEASNYFKKAIRIDSTEPKLLINYAKSLNELKKFEESAKYSKKSLSIDSGDWNGWFTYANALFNLKEYESALVAYKEAMKINPHSPELITSAAILLNTINCHEDAKYYCEKAINLKYNHINLWQCYGNCMFALNNFEVALNAYEEVTIKDQNNIKGLIGKSAVLGQIGEYLSAIDICEKILAIDPINIDGLVNKAKCLADIRKYAEALECLDKVFLSKPNHEQALINQGFCFQSLGNYDEAISAYLKCLKINPKNSEANVNLSQILLWNFDFEDGWTGYSYRFENKKYKSFNLKTHKNKWDFVGSGKRVYIWGEQGIGDQILHCSLLSNLIPSNKYFVGLDGKLLELMARSFPNFEFVDRNKVSSDEFFDEYIYSGDLMPFFIKTKEDFKNKKHKFLQSNLDRVEVLKKKINTSKKIIGISWLSSNNQIGAEKSIPLQQLDLLFKLEQCNFIDLQYRDIELNKKNLYQFDEYNLIKVNEIDIFSDIDGLAALIDSCDCIITISNTTAHLAGALGKKTFLMLPFGRGMLWYWHSLSGLSVWYPTVRIIQQQKVGDWFGPILELIKCLEEDVLAK